MKNNTSSFILIILLHVCMGEKFVHMGQEVEIVCQSPEKNADMLKWTRTPKNGDFILSHRSISIPKVNVTDSGLYQCKSKVQGSAPHGTVLAVWTQPITKVSITRVYRAKESCQQDVFQKFVQTAKRALCTELWKCKIKVDSFCLTNNEKGVLGQEYPWHFGVYAYMLVDELSVEETVDCDPGCLRQRRMHDPTVMFDIALDRLEQEEKKWIKKNFKVSHGVQLDEKQSKELVTEMLCGYEGYHLHGQSMCLPCQPGHYRPKDKKFHRSNTECLPCQKGHYQPEYAAKACMSCPPPGEQPHHPQCGHNTALQPYTAGGQTDVTEEEVEEEDDDDQPCGSSLSSTMASSWLALTGKLEKMSSRDITAVLCVTILGLMIVPIMCVCCMLGCVRSLIQVRASLEAASQHVTASKKRKAKADTPQYYRSSSPKDGADTTQYYSPKVEGREYESIHTDPYLDLSDGYEMLNTPLNSTMQEDAPETTARSKLNDKRFSVYSTAGQAPKKEPTDRQQFAQPQYLPGYERPVPYQETNTPENVTVRGNRIYDQHYPSNFAQNNSLFDPMVITTDSNNQGSKQRIDLSTTDDNFGQHNSKEVATKLNENLLNVLENSPAKKKNESPTKSASNVYNRSHRMSDTTDVRRNFDDHKANDISRSNVINLCHPLSKPADVTKSNKYPDKLFSEDSNGPSNRRPQTMTKLNLITGLKPLAKPAQNYSPHKHIAGPQSTTLPEVIRSPQKPTLDTNTKPTQQISNNKNSSQMIASTNSTQNNNNNRRIVMKLSPTKKQLPTQPGDFGQMHRKPDTTKKQFPTQPEGNFGQINQQPDTTKKQLPTQPEGNFGQMNRKPDTTKKQFPTQPQGDFGQTNRQPHRTKKRFLTQPEGDVGQINRQPDTTKKQFPTQPEGNFGQINRQPILTAEKTFPGLQDGHNIKVKDPLHLQASITAQGKTPMNANPHAQHPRGPSRENPIERKPQETQNNNRYLLNIRPDGADKTVPSVSTGNYGQRVLRNHVTGPPPPPYR